jgi:putative oxidoreductase
MVLLGWHARVGAAALLAFTVVATLLAHNPFGRAGDDFRREVMLSMEHLAIVGGLLLIAVEGPGPLSLLP